MCTKFIGQFLRGKITSIAYILKYICSIKCKQILERIFRRKFCIGYIWKFFWIIRYLQILNSEDMHRFQGELLKRPLVLIFGNVLGQ
jgi:hypothetical protein